MRASSIVADNSRPTGPKVAIYCRTAHTESSISEQETKLRMVAAANAWEVVAVYRDEATSGLKREREGIDLLLKDVRRGQPEFQLVLLRARSALARNAALYMEWEGFLNAHEIQIVLPIMSEPMSCGRIARHFEPWLQKKSRGSGQ